MSDFEKVKEEWQTLFYTTLGGAMQAGSTFNLGEKVKNITSQLSTKIISIWKIGLFF